MMAIIISVLKARLAAIAIANAALHVLALVGKGYACFDPETVGAAFDSGASVVIGVTGTLGLLFPGLAKAVQFTDVPTKG